MAQAPGRGWQDMVTDAAGIYPSVIRYGGGYWSEIIGATSAQVADVLDGLLRLGRRPDQSREIVAELLQRWRDYAVSVGGTFERILLDFNQSLVTLGRMYPPAAPAMSVDPTGSADATLAVFRQLADFAASEAIKVQTGQGSADLDALRQRLESILAELRRLQGGGGR